MSKVKITQQYLSDIADAIRTKLDTSDTYLPSEMADAIESISGGSVSELVDNPDYFISESDDYIVTLKGGEAAFLKPISPTVSITDWTYGDDPSEPDVQGNTGSGEVTCNQRQTVI